ncbi:tetratricopeptide repeat protein [Candidatus Cloacimonadota bacterium]
MLQADNTTIKDEIRKLVDLADKQRLANDIYNCQKTIDLLFDLSEKNEQVDGLIQANILMGLLQVSLSNYDSALHHYAAAYNLAYESEDFMQIATILNNKAQIYTQLNNLEEAAKLYRRSIEFDKNNYRAINNLAIIFARQEEFDKAEQRFKEALHVAQTLNETRSIAICNINLGEVATNRKNITEALEYLNRASHFNANLEDPDLEIILKLDYSKVYIETAEFSTAEKFAREALSLTKKSNDQIILLRCYEILAEIFALKDDLKQAYQYSSKQAKLAEKIFSKQLQIKITNIHSMYEIQNKEMQLRQMMEQSSKLTSIGVMAAGITHEINQPLNAISVSANSILYWNKRNPGKLPELFIEEVEQISKGSRRIEEIIRHMRDFWITPDDASGEKININTAIKDSLSLIENQLRSHGIKIIKQLHKDDLFIKANKINVEQIVLNLIINSMHSLDEKSSKTKLIKIITEIKADKIILEIIDNGIGIPDDKDIFDPFFSTKAPGRGMGLGLAIVKNIVDKLSGSIVASNADEGAILHLEFPRENKL